MKFPYGISDFKEIATQGYFYCDRTDRIPFVERGKYLLFLRPRRFGKSLLVSMLANYYDVARKDMFESIFGGLAIGKNPTPLHNKFFILQWDFCCVDTFGSAKDIRKALYNHINVRIKGFMRYYESFGLKGVEINPDDAINSIESLIAAVRMTDYSIYLLIDEYDNFANQVMMSISRTQQERYNALVFEEGHLRTLFKVVKSGTSESLFDRIFITGVSPVVMSDITSGYNIGENIYLNTVFNDLCGFTGEEIENGIRAVVKNCNLKEEEKACTLNMMRTYYNGYKFAPDADQPVYNPTLAIYFFKAFYENCKYPRNMLDSNLATDEAKLQYISLVPAGRQILLDLVQKDQQVVISNVEDSFGIRKMLEDRSQDNSFMVSFLYYFGVLTMEGETDAGKIMLKVPNLVIQRLYAESLCEMLLPKPADRDEGKKAADILHSTGDMKPLCEFIEDRYFKVFHNPDYKWANELTVKTAFLTLLYNDILYLMDSELEIDRRYSDLTMIIRPDMRRFKIFDILIEFKFVKLKDVEMTGRQVRALTPEKLHGIDRMRAEMEDARTQVNDYGDALEQKYKNLRLRRYAVVSLGFERLWWEEQKLSTPKGGKHE
ncbi:AAA family ATPase [Desulfobacterales bacterium HSG16]|nr:AAA family ATPase [Desulfobacterales bacterium HSG16]